ncbi:MAG: GerMN domain-containing protein, partial [Acidimicrobiales bacterium]
MSGPKRFAAGTLAVLAGLVFCACGVPISGSPQALGNDVVPRPPTVGSTLPPQSDDLSLTIVLLKGDVPTPVNRFTPAHLDRLDTVLNDLLAGPAPSEQLRGYTTALAGTQLISVTPNPFVNTNQAIPGSVTVNLSPDFLAISGIDQVLAVTQVVFTVACNLPAATKVAFQVAGLT